MPFGFAHQQVHVLRHDHISGDVEAVLPPRPFQRDFKQVFGMCTGQQRLTAIATEGHEVQITGLLVSLESPRHGGSINDPLPASLRCSIQSPVTESVTSDDPPTQAKKAWVGHPHPDGGVGHPPLLLLVVLLETLSRDGKYLTQPKEGWVGHPVEPKPVPRTNPEGKSAPPISSHPNQVRARA